MAGLMARTALVRVAVTVLACAVAVVVAYSRGKAAGAAAVQARWDAEKLAQQRTVIAALEARDQATRTLAAKSAASSKEYHRALQSVTAERDRLLGSLRDRPERPDGGAGVPDHTAARAEPASCTGAELYRDDAAFLVRLAAEADQLRAAVQRCQAAYDAIAGTFPKISPQAH